MSIEDAIKALQDGRCVALPTETVYGLAADITQPAAVRRVFGLKQRPLDHPLIIHLAPEMDLTPWVAEVPVQGRKLMNQYWPGPLTLVFKKSSLVGDWVTGGQDTVAIRVPAHPLTQQVIQGLGQPIAAPSANKFGHVSPTCAEHVRQEFPGIKLLILDGGPCTVGIESTIVDITGEPTILRPGMLSANDLKIYKTTDKTSPKVSGSLASHYAPNIPIVLYDNVQYYQQLIKTHPHNFVINLDQQSPEHYAQQLYHQLHVGEACGAEIILIEHPPKTPAWAGVIDRLTRAAAMPATCQGAGD